MKLNIPENPRNIRISTYLNVDEASELLAIVGEQSLASWLRDLILETISKAGKNT